MGISSKFSAKIFGTLITATSYIQYKLCVLIPCLQERLHISYHADHSLESFCHWQQEIQPDMESSNGRDQGVAHHDNAVLLTRSVTNGYHLGYLLLTTMTTLSSSLRSVSNACNVATTFRLPLH